MAKVTIYGRKNCGFSGRVIELCQLHELEFEYIDIDDSSSYLTELHQITKTPITDMPQIVIDQKHIGGYAQFNSYLQAQKEKSSKAS